MEVRIGNAAVLLVRLVNGKVHGHTPAHKVVQQKLPCKPDTTTADEPSAAAQMQSQLQSAMNFEGSADEKKARAFLTTFGIDYDAISKEQFVNLIEVLKLSKHMKSPISQRGKASPYQSHGKGKKKHK